MTDQEIKTDLDEVVGIAKIAFSSFLVLEYLHQTIFGMEGEIIDNNAFLRTSIFAYWRLTVLELTKPPLVLVYNEDATAWRLQRQSHSRQLQEKGTPVSHTQQYYI